MKTRIDVGGMLGTLAMVVLLCAAAPVYAGFAYNFENLNTSGVENQDNWAIVANFGLDVVAGPAGSVDTTNVAVAHDQTNGSLSDRPMSPLYYTSADTAAYQTIWGKVGSADNVHASMSAGAMFVTGPSWPNGNPWLPIFGGDPNGAQDGTFSTYLRVVPGAAEYFGDSNLKESDWYQFKLTMNFAVTGCAATLSYKDLTAGDPAFTQDGTIVNVNLGLPTDSQGRYEVTGITARLLGNSSYLDNFYVSLPGEPTPEPGSLVLLATGLLGLLAYAWRKRK